MDLISSQAEVIAQIRAGNDRVIESLYKSTFAYCASYVLKNEGSREDAKDSFQRAFMVLVEKAKDEGFEIKHNLKSYLYGITRYIWIGEIEKRKRQRDLSTPTQEEAEESIFIGEEDMKELRFQKMYKALEQLSSDCQKLIQLTFFKNKRDKEIAKLMNYADDFVRNKRGRCMKSLKKIVGA
ncbi:MAG: sigma-70 family RNA polymerase sigma factor [Bacteroidota bacterium]